MEFDLDEVPFLRIGGQPVSMGQAFLCLQHFGRLRPFVQDVFRYYAIYQEIQSRDDLSVTDSELNQKIAQLQIRENLSGSEKFDRWLMTQGIDYPTFEKQVLVELKLTKLKAKILDSEAGSYFKIHRDSFDQVELYHIIVAGKSLARKIKTQICAGKTFEQIAREYPLSSANRVLVKRDFLRRQKIREEISVALSTANLGELIGPVPMGNHWCLFRVEQILPAVLDESVKLELQELLFEQWLTQKLQQLKVEVPITQEV
jgi:hypothetical protein